MSKNLKVVTVTLNPALDLTGSLEALQTGSVNLIETGSLHPAGKGINVAKVLAELGAKVTVTGFLGTNNQASFVELFESLKINDQFIRVQGDTRINVKIVEKSGQVSDLNFPGVIVGESELAEFERTLFKLSKTHDVFVIAGSLPQGVTPEHCAGWIETLNKAGKKVFFDSSNKALAAGVNAHPYLVKPNDEELSALLNLPLKNTDEIKNAAQQLQQQGCHNVVISMGENGVLWLNQAGWLKSTPPKMEVVSTVGAGDTLVAGLCWSELNQWDKSQSLSFATALSALAVSQVGVGVEDIDQVEALQKNIKITQE
ncbi:1-phosphofructokinase [Psychromonas ingrahamii 37]|uniref:Phosphofructokinase n=1 Tax=Psychromonas ingrahamii (strain DSM 17664 / CCUG 51855 / 37) TaxID=357804 RepID=A1T0H0_PSYIN|nr:1-phosphofructokinase [Psychromonas ingrahamii]ABM05235.1 1-phosphofructokinase [Psychromonas ingrahamii 37]